MPADNSNVFSPQDLTRTEDQNRAFPNARGQVVPAIESAPEEPQDWQTPMAKPENGFQPEGTPLTFEPRPKEVNKILNSKHVLSDVDISDPSNARVFVANFLNSKYSEDKRGIYKDYEGKTKAYGLSGDPVADAKAILDGDTRTHQSAATLIAKRKKSMEPADSGAFGMATGLPRMAQESGGKGILATGQGAYAIGAEMTEELNKTLQRSSEDVGRLKEIEQELSRISGEDLSTGSERMAGKIGRAAASSRGYQDLESQLVESRESGQSLESIQDEKRSALIAERDELEGAWKQRMSESTTRVIADEWDRLSELLRESGENLVFEDVPQDVRESLAGKYASGAGGMFQMMLKAPIAPLLFTELYAHAENQERQVIEARGEVFDRSEGFDTRIMETAINTYVEKALGAERAIAGLIKTLGSRGGKVTVKQALKEIGIEGTKSAVGETADETVQGTVSDFTRKLTYDPDYDMTLSSFVERRGMDALIAGPLGFFMGGGVRGLDLATRSDEANMLDQLMDPVKGMSAVDMALAYNVIPEPEFNLYIEEQFGDQTTEEGVPLQELAKKARQGDRKAAEELVANTTVEASQAAVEAGLTPEEAEARGKEAAEVADPIEPLVETAIDKEISAKKEELVALEEAEDSTPEDMKKYEKLDKEIQALETKRVEEIVKGKIMTPFTRGIEAEQKRVEQARLDKEDKDLEEQDQVIDLINFLSPLSVNTTVENMPELAAGGAAIIQGWKDAGFSKKEIEAKSKELMTAQGMPNTRLEDVVQKGSQKSTKTGGSPIQSLIKLFKGANPFTVVEEFAHAEYDREIAEGTVTVEQVREWRKAVEELTETPDLRGETDEDIKEWVAEQVKARIYGQRNNLSLPESFLKFLDDIISKFKQILGRAKELQDLEASGQLPTDFLEMLDRQGLVGKPASIVVDGSNVTLDPNAQVFPSEDGGAVGPATFSLEAFHGTPHKVDKFSTEKIGTGEGLQAYGFGLYFAQNKSVAVSYQRGLSANKSTIDGKDVPSDWQDIDGLGMLSGAALRAANGDKDKALERLRSKMARADRRAELGGRVGASDIVSEAIRELENFDESRLNVAQGSLYKVELNVEQDELLDWDKPLSEQSDKVKAALYEYKLSGNSEDVMLLRELYSDGVTTDLLGVFPNSKGGQIYNTLAGESENFKGLSEALHAAGIKGIRYLDGQSRNADWKLSSPNETVAGDWMVKDSKKPLSDGVHFDTESDARAFVEEKSKANSNYVVFNDSDITVTEENGEAVELPAKAPSFSLAPAPSGVEVSISEKSDKITLNKLIVDKDARGSGKGSEYMNTLTEYADATGKRITLTPSKDFGGSSVSRLKAFYKRFGFVENKGKNKDFEESDSMYRDPAEESYSLEKSPTSLRLKMTRKQIIESIEGSKDWKDFYTRSKELMVEYFGADAPLFERLLSATSQAASVKANVSLALKAYGQLKRGDKFTGYLPAVIGNLNKISKNEKLGGRKISNYENANAGDVTKVVVDRHVARMLFGTKSPTAKQFSKAEKVLTEVANDIGWEPRQVQAAIWAASIRKNNLEPESYDGYLKKLKREGTLEQKVGFSFLERSAENIGSGDGRPDTRQSAREAFSLEPLSEQDADAIVTERTEEIQSRTPERQAFIDYQRELRRTQLDNTEEEKKKLQKLLQLATDADEIAELKQAGDEKIIRVVEQKVKQIRKQAAEREDVTESVKALERLINSPEVPMEVRARMRGFGRLAERKTPQGKARWVEQMSNKLEAEIDRHYRTRNVRALRSFLRPFATQYAPNRRKLRLKKGEDARFELEFAQRLLNNSEATPPEGMTDARRDELIDIFGDVGNRQSSPTRVAAALEIARGISGDGRKVREEFEEDRRQRNEQVGDLVREEVLNGEEAMGKSQIAAREKQRNAFKKGYDYMRSRLIRGMEGFQQQLNKMDSVKGGVLESLFLPAVYQADQNEKALNREHVERVNEDFKTVLGTDNRQAASWYENSHELHDTDIEWIEDKAIGMEKRTISKQQGVSVLMQWLDPSLRSTFSNMGINESTIEQIKEFIGEIGVSEAYYFRERYAEMGIKLNAKHMEVEGIPLDMVDGYGGRARRINSVGSRQEDMQMFSTNSAGRPTVKSGSMKERTNSTDYLDIPRRCDGLLGTRQGGQPLH